ncbi:hypothetical protein PINS_up023205 [Pythium insidiosum]|nr:hypothetical protein PINS_up023205 [Pythium insidiosum]
MVYLKRGDLFAIGNTKYELEHQRVTDVTSFQGHIAFSNAFPGLLESKENTHRVILGLIYNPLLSIVGWSMLALAVIAGLRYVVTIVQISVAGTPRHAGGSKSSAIVRALLGLGTKQRSRVYVANEDELSTSPDEGSSLPESVLHRYKRLTVEELLDQPIRARSLLRNLESMETIYEGERSVRMSLFLEHGIIMSNGCLKTRFGFFDLVRSFLTAHKHCETHVAPGGEARLVALR